MSSAAWSDPLLRAPNLVCSAQELFPVHAGEPTLCWVLELNWDQVPSTWCLLPAPPGCPLLFLLTGSGLLRAQACSLDSG